MFFFVVVWKEVLIALVTHRCPGDDIGEVPKFFGFCTSMYGPQRNILLLYDYCTPCALDRQRRWFVLNPSTSMLLIYTHEVDLKVSPSETSRRSSGSIPKAFPLDCAHVSCEIDR